MNALFFCKFGGSALQKTLYALIELQEIDMKLASLIEERGELPKIVDDIQSSISNKKNLHSEQTEKIKKLKIEEKNSELELETIKGQLKKYEDQLYKVKTNKEYDAIANETEIAKKKLNNLETKILETAEEIENLIKNNLEIEKELKELEIKFKESESELKGKINASSEEENILKQEREIVKNNLTREQIVTYERIRDAKKGMAVAYSNGGICSGCYAFIPPQKVVEIRNMKRIFKCESCGRILVWNNEKTG
jgi:predicted  nucleic acid-binding Zn-ribbon protein